MRIALQIALILLLFVPITRAQDADPADVASVDAIITALYEAISAPENASPDWDRYHSLFLPEARLTAIGRDSTGAIVHQTWSPQQYEEVTRQWFETNPFFEIELSSVQERFGNMAHAYSTYASYHSLEDEAPYSRGINSFQLLHEGGRWWILSVFWQPEWEDLPLPARYLPSETDN